METFLLIFDVALFILLIVAVALLFGLKKGGNTAIFDEFRKNRDEARESGKASREELSKGLDGIGGRLADMTKENYQSRIDLSEKIGASLNAIRQNNQEQMDKQAHMVTEAVASMQESNEKKLDEMRKTVDEKLTATLTTRLDSSFKTVSAQLENVYKSLGEMKELSAGVTDNMTHLNKTLSNVKVRGTWAEVQLESILDQTIPGMYVTNYSPKGNNERVEFAVKIPNGEKKGELIYLPIDSKFPMEDYIRVCDAAGCADPNELASARKALEDRVLSEAKEVRKYIVVPKTTPFAILYLATEGLYAEIVSSKDGLLEKLQAQNIMVAGPATVTALLNSLAMGFKTVAINEKANEVRGLLAAAKAQYDSFGALLEKARRKIGEAGQSLDDAQKRNDIIQKKLRSVEALDTTEADELLGLSSDSETE